MGDYNMAAKKKTAKRRAADKPRKTYELLDLLKKARDELARLLQRERARSLKDEELVTGLKEVEEQLERIMLHKRGPFP